jgi:hypothetical protein
MQSTPSVRRGIMVLALTMAFFYQHGVSLRAHPGPWPQCSSVCGAADCTDGCYVDGIAFENGDRITCLDYGTWDTSESCCGDGYCDMSSGANNECGNCSADCGSGCGGTTSPCNPTSQTGCSSGYVCAPNGVCLQVPNCTGGTCNNGTVTSPPCEDSYCGNGGTCCSGDVCYNPYPGYTYGFCVPSITHPPGVPLTTGPRSER